MSALQEFKEFILRGNVVDLAVGVVIGGAFGGIVQALIKDIITPIIGIFFSDPKKPISFSDYNFTIHGSKFLVGDFLNIVISFLLIAAVVFFLVVKPINHLQSLQKRGDVPEAAPELTREEVLLTEIRDSLKTRAS